MTAGGHAVLSLWELPKIRGTCLGVILVLYWDSGKENGNYNLGFRVCRGILPTIMENQMEKTMENEMEIGGI